MKELDNQELSLHGTASRKLTSTRSKSTRNTSPEPSSSDQLLLLTEENSQSSTLSLSDSLAKICQLLENEKDLKVEEVGYFLKQLELLTKISPIILSLKTSKVFYQATKERTLKQYCEQLPTLGTMVNGNCLILPGFSRKTESGYILSDILEDNVGQKFFLSDKAVAVLMKYNERQEQNGRGFRAEFTKENEIKSALKVGGKGTSDLISVVAMRGRGKDNKQTLEKRSDNKTNSLTSVQKDNLIICKNQQ